MNEPGPKLAKDVYALSIACGQIAVGFNLVETGARFDKAAKLALQTKAAPPEKDPRAGTHDDNISNGVALLYRGSQGERIKTIQEGLYRVASSLSDLMSHYDNPSAERMYDAAHQAASRGI